MPRYLQSIIPFVVICIYSILAHQVCNAENPPAWKGNKIGISDVPPPPFTPVTVKMSGDAASIGCWGRTYVLADVGLPVQIRSKDADLLSAPVRLVTESEGRAVEWKSTGVKLVKTSQVQVVLEGAAQSRIGKLDWKCTAEYDGLLRYDLQITPSPGATVDKLEMVFSVKPEHATLNWQPGASTPHHHGRLLPGDGIIESYGANWYTWLGDLDRGMAIFFRTDEAWDDPNRLDAFRIERHPGSVNVVWSFIKGTKPLPKSWTYTFGVEATPVKKTPGGRKHMVASHLPVGLGNFTVPWATPRTEKYFGYPEATSPERFQALVEFYHKQSIKVCPYILLNLISVGAPELAAHPEWKGDLVEKGKGEGGASDVAAFGNDIYASVPTPDFIDWIVWKCDRYVRENNLDGLYHDYTVMMVLTDIPQGFGYMRDGKPVRCYPLFEERELYKRIYTMLKQYKRDAINIGHMSGSMYVPFLTFCDVILEGEQFRFPDKTYQDLLPDDYIQAEIMGHNYGLTSMFLTQWSRLAPKQDPRFLLGLALLYDFGLWIAEEKPEHRAYKAFRDFGTMDAEFVPFWHAGDIIRGQTEEVRCSAYLRKKGGAMLVFFNRSKEPREMTFTVDWKKLKVPGKPVVRDVMPMGWDELVDNILPVKGEQMTVNVPAEDFRLVAVE